MSDESDPEAPFLSMRRSVEAEHANRRAIFAGRPRRIEPFREPADEMEGGESSEDGARIASAARLARVGSNEAGSRRNLGTRAPQPLGLTAGEARRPRVVLRVPRRGQGTEEGDMDVVPGRAEGSVGIRRTIGLARAPVPPLPGAARTLALQRAAAANVEAIERLSAVSEAARREALVQRGTAARASELRRSQLAAERERVLRPPVRLERTVDSSDDDSLDSGRARVRRRLNEVPVVAIPHRMRRAEGSTSTSSSRAGSVSRPATAGPSIGRRSTVVDLTAESDDEVVEVDRPVPPQTARRTGTFGLGHEARDRPGPYEGLAAIRERRAAAVRAAAAEHAGDPGPVRSRPMGMQDVEAILSRRTAEAQRIRDERDRLRRLQSPPPQPAAPIGFGGAIIHRGGQQIRYQPGDGMIQRVVAPQPQRHALFGEWGLGLADLGRAGRGLMFGDGDDPGFLRRLYQYGALPGVGPPPAVRPPAPDIPAILAGIEQPTHPDPLPGFTNNFDVDAARPIVIDDNGDVVKSKKKPGLVCFVCKKRLRLSGSYRSEDDRVWTLRCGHMLDQKCLVQLCTPTTPMQIDSIIPPLNPPLPVLGSAEKKKRKTKKVQKEVPREYGWQCSAKGCGKAHKSVKMPGTENWVQVAGAGAFQVFM